MPEFMFARKHIVLQFVFILDESNGDNIIFNEKYVDQRDPYIKYYYPGFILSSFLYFGYCPFKKHDETN
jgi:hypothetical protein